MSRRFTTVALTFFLILKPLCSMSNALQIIPECYVDTNLVSALLGGIGVNHQKSCNKVVARMQDKYGDDFAVGIIDRDKRRPGYLNDFSLVAESAHLSLYKHPSKHHYIITVAPAAEGFIISEVEQAGLSLTDYGLPSYLKGLLKITKHIVTNRDGRLVHLFHDLSSCGETRLLKDVLGYLLDKKYDASIEELKDLFS